MAVYIDDAGIPADIPNGDKVVSSNWSHLTADTPEELREAAARLRLNPRWIQYPGTPKEHFDLTSGKRAQAIARGIAQPITWRESGERYVAKVQEQQIRDRDQRTGEAFKRGELLIAAQMIQDAREKWPAQEELWSVRLERITSAMREANQADDLHRPLDEVVSERASRYGFAADDPGRQEIAEWNSTQISRAAPDIAEHLGSAERRRTAFEQEMRQEAGQ